MGCLVREFISDKFTVENLFGNKIGPENVEFYHDFFLVLLFRWKLKIQAKLN